MQRNHTHIISSAGWHTAFESKERAGELQEKLSNWCHRQMPNEINAVFDKMCPPDQVWRINTLELDLGTIDLNELETTLTARFQNRLYETMRALVYYAGRSGDNGIEIVDRYTSLLETIAAYLVNGYLPWNGLPMQGSLSDWIELELRHNRQPLIALIRQVAVDDEQVRKRIAWQTTDSCIRKIIAGLEPVHHNEITDFADELVKLQKNNPVVRASTNDFSKNLWLWVLNYLLDEKGTLFNKVAFLRSNIRQMAAHYNIQYSHLLQLLKQAVVIVQQKNAVKTHFVNMILMVAQDIATAPTTTTTDTPITDYWATLRAMLANPLLRKNSAGALMLNELLVSLYNESPERLIRLLDVPALPHDIWASLAPQLTAASVQVLFHCFAPAKAHGLLQAITLLQEAAREQAVVVNIRVLWQEGLTLLYKNRPGGCSEAILMQACIAAMARHKNIAPIQLYARLMVAAMPSALHGPTALETYGTLQTLCHKGLGEGRGADAIQQQLNQLLDQIKQSVQPSPTAYHSVAKYFDQLHSSLRSHPHAVGAALKALKDEALLVDTILPRLRITEIHQLLQQASMPKQQCYAQLMALLQQASSAGSISALSYIIKDKLPRLAITILLLQPQLSAPQFIRGVLQQLLPVLSSAERAVLQAIVKADALQGQPMAMGLCKAIEKADNPYRYIFQPALWQRLKAISSSTRQKLLAYLLREFNNSTFATVRHQNGAPATALLHVLCRDAAMGMHSLVTQYAAWLQQKGMGTAANIVPQLRHLYWKALVHLPAHGMHKQSIAQAFAAAVAAYYSCNWNDMPTPLIGTAPLQNQRRLVRLNGGALITEEQLFALLEKSWLAQDAPIDYEGKLYTLGQLITTALRTAPALLRSKLLRIAKQPHTAGRLAAAIGFGEFGTWVMHDKGYLPSAGMAQLTKLHALALRLLTGSNRLNWEQRCWLLALEMLGTTTVSQQRVTQLAADLFEIAASKGNASPAMVATHISQLGLEQDTPFIHLLEQALPKLATALSATATTAPAPTLAHAVENDLLPILLQQLITEQTIPHWLGMDRRTNASSLLGEILLHYPHQMLQAWHPLELSQRQMEWVTEQLDFGTWIQALIRMEPARQAQLYILQDFHRALGHIAIKGIGTEALQVWLFTKIIRAWQNDNWRILGTENILNELLWELHTRHGVSKNSFIEGFAQHRAQLPPALQTAFTLGFEQRASSGQTAKPKVLPPMPAIKATAQATVKPATVAAPTILVKNAGIVLLNSYVPLLFDRLGILDNKTFAQPDLQADAVHYLQYVITGQTATEESFLPLNKLLCGLPLEAPVKSGIEMLPAQQQLINGLLQAAINYWPAIGENSLNGFRGNWLVRDGHLSEQDDNWHLLVDKRAYDILIGQSPFSFSVIKFPWMPKPLKVTWPY